MGLNTLADIKNKLNTKRYINSNNCWLWLGDCSKKGYGRISWIGKRWYVHVLSAYLFLDYKPDSGKLVLHKLNCPNKNCFNPEHLYIGTNTDNMRDALKIGFTHRNRNSDITQCMYGH